MLPTQVCVPRFNGIPAARRRRHHGHSRRRQPSEQPRTGLAAGARITATLLNGLVTRDETVGLETMCVGGGQGMAMIIERLN